MSDPIVTVEQLKKYFPISKGVLFGKTTSWLKAVDGVDFAIHAGETVGLVGESGCGKTTIGLCILNLYTPTSGTVCLDGMNIHALSGANRAAYRKSVQAMFQDPYSSLNPRRRVRDTIAEPLAANTRMTKREMDDRIKEVLSHVGMPIESAELYPHEFSGGQRQRIALARALALKPRVVILDEPVSGLDISIRAQVMNLLKVLQQDLGIAYLFIAHDLANVRYMSHQVLVMYLGKIVEAAPVDELFTHALHPYTQALLLAALPAHPDAPKEGIPLAGEVPSPVNVPPGCPFHPRCVCSIPVCLEVKPNLREVESGHEVACHLHS